MSYPAMLGPTISSPRCSYSGNVDWPWTKFHRHPAARYSLLVQATSSRPLSLHQDSLLIDTRHRGPVHSLHDNGRAPPIPPFSPVDTYSTALTCSFNVGEHRPAPTRAVLQGLRNTFLSSLLDRSSRPSRSVMLCWYPTGRTTGGSVVACIQ